MQLLPEFWWSTWFTVFEVKVVDVTLARKARFSTGVLSAGGFVSGGGGPGPWALSWFIEICCLSRAFNQVKVNTSVSDSVRVLSSAISVSCILGETRPRLIT